MSYRKRDWRIRNVSYVLSYVSQGKQGKSMIKSSKLNQLKKSKKSNKLNKRILSLLFVTLICAAVLSGCGIKKGAGRADEGNTTAVQYVKPFEVNDVTAFTYVYEDQLLMFDLEDGTWQDMADASVKLDNEKVEGFLEEMSGMGAQTVFDNVDDFSEYGVDKPTQMFAAVFSDGSSLTYCFGCAYEKTGGVYVQVTDDADDTDNANVYLVDASYVTDTLNRTADDFQ